MNDQKRSFVAVAIPGRNVHEDLPLLAHWFPIGRQGGIVTAENLAVREAHGEFELLAFRVASIGQVGVDVILRADRELAVSFAAGLLFLQFCSISIGRKEKNGANASDGIKESHRNVVCSRPMQSSGG